MSFVLSKSVDASKTFMTPKSDISARWDPFYYQPHLVELEAKVRRVTPLRLRDFVVRMAGGATPSTKDADTHYTEDATGIPFIRVQNLSTTGTPNLEDCKQITRSTHEGLLARSRLTGGELLVKITGVGRMAIASVVPDGFESNINQHIVAIHTKDTRTSEILAAYLNLDMAEKLASRRSTGGTRPALDYPALLSIPIIFDERIHFMMSDASETYKAKLDQAKALVYSIDDVLLEELGVSHVMEPKNTIDSRMFLQNFSKTTGDRLDPLFHHSDIFHFMRTAPCRLCPLGQLVRYFLTGFAAGKADQSESEEDGIIQIRPTNITDGRELVFSRNVFISVDELQKRQQDTVRRREVLFNNTNSQEQVGKTAYFDLLGEYFSSNHITRIGVDEHEIDAQYLYYLLNLYQRRKVFFKLCTNWNNQSGVGVDVLRKISVPLPELMQQRQIVQRLEAIRTNANELRKQAETEFENSKRFIETTILGDTKTT